MKVDIFNKIVTAIFRAFFYPLKELGDFCGLLILSGLTGFVMLIIFKKVSNQAGILAIKNRIKAHLLAIRLYKHDGVLSLRVMGHIFIENGRYFLYALKPTLVMMIPVAIIIIQLSARYGYNTAEVGKSILVSVKADDSVDLNEISLTASSGIRIDMPPIFIPSTHEINWRIYALESGISTLTFQHEQEREQKKIVADERGELLSAKRVRSSLIGFLYPTERKLAHNSFLKEISVGYSENILQLAGFRIHWLVFFILTFVAIGFLAKKLFRVHI